MSIYQTVTHSRSMTTEQLANEGFTPDQIDRLTALAQNCPWIEFVASSDEWRQLIFLKWRYETGRIEA